MRSLRLPPALAVALAALAALLALAAPAGAETRIVGSGPLAAALPAGGAVQKSLRFSGKGPVGSVAVWVRVDKARADDLTLTLVAPDGRTRVLADRQGAAVPALGSGGAGCKGEWLIFTDEGFESLDKAEWPYQGWVTPAQPLAALKGMPAAGRWSLRVANAAGGATGALTCWRLELALDIDSTISATAGEVSASVTFRELNSQYSKVRLRIDGPQARLATTLAGLRCEECSSEGPNLLAAKQPLRVVDLDADDRPEVILDTYTGGAHCCSVSLIFREDAGKWLHTVAWWGNPGYRLADLDRDGRPELLTADDTFGYLFTSWASSGEPLLVFRWQAGKLVDVTRSFPKQVQADADSYWQAAKEQLAAKDGEARGLLAAWAADMANLGKSGEAFRTLDQLAASGKLGDNEQMGTAAGAAYVKALRAHLRKEGYLPTVRTTSTALPAGSAARP